MNKLLTPAILTRYSPRKDKSVSITFETNEVDALFISDLHGKMGMFGGLVFKPEEQLTKEEISEIDSLDFEMTGKTKAQKLRDTLYIKWSKTDKATNFKDYYGQQMDIIRMIIINGFDD